MPRIEPLQRRHRAALIEMAESFRAVGDDRYAALLEDPDAWLDDAERSAAGRDLPPDRVPQTVYLLFDADRVVGAARLRERLIPVLERDGGHIGYEIRPEDRGRGLATQLLEAVLDRARANGLEGVLVTAAIDNAASRRVIEKCGGRSDGTRISPRTGETMVRYWIDLADRGAPA